jgi:general secretion pathway protein D
MNTKNLFLSALAFTFAASTQVSAQGRPPGSPPASRPAATQPGNQANAANTYEHTTSADGKLQSFKFEGADLDTVMTVYGEWTKKIYLKNDSVKANITLKADKLTIPESIEVVEAILAMNNIAIVPMGDKFIKVVMATAPDLGGQGLPTHLDPETQYAGSHRLVTQIIPLKNVQIPEVQTAVQHLMHAFGKIQTLERSNSLLITDTEVNIDRIRELLEFIDQATARIEPKIYQIQYAEATEIAAKINEIVTAAQADQPAAATAVGNPYARTPPGVIRAGARQAANAPTQATISKTEGSATAIIQGTVKVMSDDRTNIIIIFSVKDNFDFFDQIIKVLDIEVEPAINFEVINLEYADAEELSGTLNELVGAATGTRTSSSSSSSSRSSSSRTGSSRTSGVQREGSSSRTTGNTSRVTPNASPSGASAIANLNRLSENTKILADVRSNSILLMGEKADIAALKNVIKSLDIMLEQVRIEAAIFEIQLGNGIDHGIEWVYRSQNGLKLGAWDGLGLATNAIDSIASGALTYYQNITGINTELAINAAATDSDVRLVSTPVIMTTDNTEASLNIGQQRPVVTSTDSFANSSGTQRSNYEYKDIGIQLTVTPRINPQRMVVMEILQKADQVGREIPIDGNPVPIILNREMEAQVSVPDRGTIALGGLVDSKVNDTIAKIPILGDIPLLGRYLFSSVHKETERNELIVLLTPYVLTTEQEMLDDTKKLYDSTDMLPKDWPSRGWSQSELRFHEKPDLNEGENAEQADTEVIQYQSPPQNFSPAPLPATHGSDADKQEMKQLLNELNN